MKTNQPYWPAAVKFITGVDTGPDKDQTVTFEVNQDAGTVQLTNQITDEDLQRMHDYHVSNNQYAY